MEIVMPDWIEPFFNIRVYTFIMVNYLPTMLNPTRWNNLSLFENVNNISSLYVVFVQSYLF